MASTLILHNIVSSSPFCQKCSRKGTLALNRSQFLSSNSISNLKKQSLYSFNKIKLTERTSPHRAAFVFAAQSDLVRVFQNIWKVGKDGIDAGTKMVPDSVPRPVARISVTVVALSVALFVLKSFLSTAFFVLATMGLIYFIFIALNKDEGPRGGGGGGGSTSTDDSLEEARRIMEKYK